MCLQVILSFLYSMIIFRFFCDNLLTRFFLCLCSPSTHFVTFVVQRIGLTPLHLAQRELSHNSNKQDFSPSPALVTNLHTTYSYFLFLFSQMQTPSHLKFGHVRFFLLAKENITQSTFLPLHSKHFKSIHFSQFALNFTAIRYSCTNAHSV